MTNTRTLTFGTNQHSTTTKTLNIGDNGVDVMFDYHNSDGKSVYSNISHDEAKKLRDVLIELFPLAQASTFDPKNPKVGDVVLMNENSSDNVGYFKLHFRNLEAPFTITARRSYSKWEDTYLVDFTDRNGKSGACFSHRFKAYGRPVVEKPITKADLLAAEERGRATSFAAGKRAGREEAEAERKAKQPKWEVVAHGLDRCKVEGGYIYQTDNEHIAFVPSTPNATAVKDPCPFHPSCSSLTNGKA